MSQYQIKTTTPEDHVALLSFLLLAGYSYPYGLKTIEEYNKQYGAFKFPHILIYDNKGLGGNYKYNPDCGDELEYPQDITEIFNRIINVEPTTITIEDVGDYDAIVTKDIIMVGRQTISFEKFDELSKAVAKFKEQ